MTSLTRVADGMLQDPEIVRLDQLPSYDSALEEIQQEIEDLKPIIQSKVPVGYQMVWTDLKNIPFAWNEMPGLAFATRPQFGILQLDDDIDSPMVYQDHFKAATSSSLSRTKEKFVGKIPQSRKVNGMTLDKDIVITADLIGVYSETYMRTKINDAKALQDSYVPVTRTINGKPLSSNVTLTLDDLGTYDRDVFTQRVRDDLFALNDVALSYTGFTQYMPPNCFRIATGSSTYSHLVNGGADRSAIPKVGIADLQPWRPNTNWQYTYVVQKPTWDAVLEKYRGVTQGFIANVTPDLDDYIDFRNFKINGISERFPGSGSNFPYRRTYYFASENIGLAGSLSTLSTFSTTKGVYQAYRCVAQGGFGTNTSTPLEIPPYIPYTVTSQNSNSISGSQMIIQGRVGPGNSWVTLTL